MLYSEFVERTGFNVDAKEYSAIEEVYYHFDGNKDEFCAWWCKGNETRIKAAKEQQRKQREEGEKEDRFISTLYVSSTAKSGKLFWGNDLQNAFLYITNEFVSAFCKKAKLEEQEVLRLSKKCLDYNCLSYRQRAICYALAYRERVDHINAF